MAKENIFMNNAREKGLVDEREIAVVADITCTNGNSGRAWVFLNGSMLQLYEVVGFADIGEHIEALDLKNAEVLKASSFALYTFLKLKCNGQTYSLKGFAQAKKVIDAVKESCGA